MKRIDNESSAAQSLGARGISAREAVRSGAFVSLLLSTVLLTGCAIVPVKTRTVGRTGEENRMDLSFIQVDKTTRDEVASKLAWMDTGLQHQRLFWGRWYGSSSAGVYLPAVLDMDSPSARRWYDHNLLIEFDAKGTVKRSGNFSDNELNVQLTRWLEEVGEPPLNLSTPLVIQIHTGSKSMTLTEDLAQFVLSNDSTFSVARKDITKLNIHRPASPADRDPGASRLAVLINFRHEKPGNSCKCLLVDVSPADYLTLVRYVPHTTGRP